MHKSSLITLKEESVTNNIHFLKKRLGKNVRMSSVVKANAYGHGIQQMVPLLEREGIDHFSVFDYHEAIQVQACLKSEATIMIMGWISDENIQDTIKKGIEFFIFNTDRMLKALNAARELNIKAKIHLDVETGMNRSGLNFDQLQTVINILLANPDYFEVNGFCTHLAGPESISNYKRIMDQLKKYNKLYQLLKSHNIHPQYKHVANSAGAIAYPKAKMDLVRIGILQYGFWPSAETFAYYHRNRKNKTDPLKRILGWESKIMAIKEIKNGEFVGYGMSFLAQTDTLTALIPIGYSCGYNRSLSNKGRVLVNGQICGIIGIVNMNMIIADITNAPNAEVGDEVVIIGKQNGIEIKVSAFSDNSNQLNYEILAHLPESIKRIII